jgi:pentose-5-phosphate-3-epimerase
MIDYFPEDKEEIMEKKEKILCASMFNLPIENMREEIIELDKSGVDIFHVDIMDFVRAI